MQVKEENQRRKSKSNLSEFRWDLEVRSHVGIRVEFEKEKSKNQSQVEKSLVSFVGENWKNGEKSLSEN